MAKAHEVDTFLQETAMYQQNEAVYLPAVLHKLPKYRSFCIPVHKV